MSNKSNYINANELAREAAMEAFKIYKQQERNDIKKNRLHNTGLLLNHYMDFIDHYETIKYKASDIIDDLEVSEICPTDQDEVIIYSIKRSKIRTKIMISQIEAAVCIVRLDMKQKNETEKIKAFELLYMDKSKKNIKYNSKVKSVAEEMTALGMPCSDSSVRRWSDEMLKEISVKLFGVDGLRLDV